MPVAFIPYKDLDKQKYDACICNAVNRMVYARSFYLDNMAAHWDALVLNDYEAVMPLPWKKKFNVKYLYQPAFIQQGGIFSPRAITDHIIFQFIEKIQIHFKFAEITLNYANMDIPPQPSITFLYRTNFIIELNKDYDTISKHYENVFLKNVKRARKLNLEYKVSKDFKSIIQLYKELYNTQLPFFLQQDFINFENTCHILDKENNVITRLVYNSSKKIIAAVVLIKDGNRLYNVISCITAEGKKHVANHFLYDNIISEFAGSDMIFDLEGSDVKGIAEFYKKLSPVAQPYPFLRFNNLHPVLKLFKE